MTLGILTGLTGLMDNNAFHDTLGNGPSAAQLIA